MHTAFQSVSCCLHIEQHKENIAARVVDSLLNQLFIILRPCNNYTEEKTWAELCIVLSKLLPRLLQHRRIQEALYNRLSLRKQVIVIKESEGANWKVPQGGSTWKFLQCHGRGGRGSRDKLIKKVQLPVFVNLQVLSTGIMIKWVHNYLC